MKSVEFLGDFYGTEPVGGHLAPRKPDLRPWLAGLGAAVVSLLRRTVPGAGGSRAELIVASSASKTNASRGVVHLVGAGPGDPELLTLRAHRLLQKADVVVYDRLVAPEILACARPDARVIYAGKAKGRHSHSQDEINALLVNHAAQGRTVVRLKGGDPFVFGRGGEELTYLRARGVTVSVVPGITAATGCAAAAGIPLTHRDLATAATFVTGHGQDGEPDLDWAALVASRQTLVIYMGVSTAGRISAQLVAHGMAPAMPVAIVENGTRPQQKVVTGTVAGLGALVADHGIVGPALIIVGEVVRAGLEIPAQVEAAA